MTIICVTRFIDLKGCKRMFWTSLSFDSAAPKPFRSLDFFRRRVSCCDVQQEVLSSLRNPETLLQSVPSGNAFFYFPSRVA